MIHKKIKEYSFLLLQITWAISQVRSLPEDALASTQPLDLQTQSNDDSVSVFVKKLDSNLNEFDVIPLGVFDPKLMDAFRRHGFLDANDAAIFRKDFVDQYPTNLEQNKIPPQEFENEQNDANNNRGLQNSHFERINIHEKKNRNNFGQVINLGPIDFGSQFHRESSNPEVNRFQGFDQNLKEFQLFDQENSLPQYEFNGDQILSPTKLENKASLSAATSFHIQNHIPVNFSPKNTVNLPSEIEINSPNEIKVNSHFQRAINTQNKASLFKENSSKNSEAQVVPGILEAKVIPGVLMRQFVDIPTTSNDPLLSIYNSPNYINQRAPSKRLIISAKDLNALPVHPIASNNQNPAKRHLNSNNFFREFERNRIQQQGHVEQGRDIASNNNVFITRGFTPSYLGRSPSFSPNIVSSASRGRSLKNDNTFSESRGLFVPGTLEGGFIPSNFLPLSSFRN